MCTKMTFMVSLLAGSLEKRKYFVEGQFLSPDNVVKPHFTPFLVAFWAPNGV